MWPAGPLQHKLTSLLPKDGAQRGRGGDAAQHGPDARSLGNKTRATCLRHFACLDQPRNRTVAATDMNLHSSRSHLAACPRAFPMYTIAQCVHKTSDCKLLGEIKWIGLLPPLRPGPNSWHHDKPGRQAVLLCHHAGTVLDVFLLTLNALSRCIA